MSSTDDNSMAESLLAPLTIFKGRGRRFTLDITPVLLLLPRDMLLPVFMNRELGGECMEGKAPGITQLT